MKRASISSFVLAVVVACGGAGGEVTRIEPSGPPEIDSAIVDDHAEQFDVEIPIRRAGSQEEQIASTYLLGHLQQAGYIVRLEAVPVEDLVRSTDVIALSPANAEDPDRLVAIAYDTHAAGDDSGSALGLFLELARATRVIDTNHDVSFAALGAEHAQIGGGKLGSRRLVNLLLDQGAEPAVILIEDIERGMPLTVAGDESQELEALAQDLGIELVVEDPLEGVAFDRAGMPTTIISGDPDAAGSLLLRFLTGGG